MSFIINHLSFIMSQFAPIPNMQISLFDSLSRQIGVSAISGYQKHVSPHKGFVCAHRVLYGGESCSQYIKRVVAEDGLKVAFVKSRERFQSCKQANHILKSQTENTEPTEEQEEETEQKPPISAPRNPSFINSHDWCSVRLRLGWMQRQMWKRRLIRQGVGDRRWHRKRRRHRRQHPRTDGGGVWRRFQWGEGSHGWSVRPVKSVNSGACFHYGTRCVFSPGGI